MHSESVLSHPDRIVCADVYYETEAVIDHMFYHDNTPPMAAKSLLQRFTSSNPSPRYVQAVATAFATGAYNGRVYSGRYGDMGAAVSAVLQDSEARSNTVQADPTTGLLRAPLDQVFHLMRAMDYQSEYLVSFGGLRGAIGQQPFNSPSVFNFFYPGEPSLLLHTLTVVSCSTGTYLAKSGGRHCRLPA